jgi:hypothetical protein
MGTCAVSRLELSRSQKFVMVQVLNCEQMRVSGFKSQNEFLWPADLGVTIKDQKRKKAIGLINHLRFLLGWRLRHQAKTVTNNLPLLSVLGVVLFSGFSY